MKRSSLLAVLCLYGGAVYAEPNNAAFLKLDANHDGYLSPAETSGLPGFSTAFSEADANHDGRLSYDEYVKAASLYDRARAEKYLDDSVITAKVKAELLASLGTHSLGLDVATDHGRVYLSGFVNSDTERQKAVQIASAVSGVTGVKDGLTLR
ncbi:MAG TPA: BON domain-containing protein [Burkholderiales bacterium]|nr:BON domain-containing protein [Burkholderiales bacterium]